MNQRMKTPVRLVKAAAALACALQVAACSSTPDWANPVEWYRGAQGWFDSSEDPAVTDARKRAKASEKTSTGSDQPFAKLSSVPERPKDLGDQRAQVQQGLAADRAQARHTDIGPTSSSSNVAAVPRETAPATASRPASTPAGAPPPPPPPATAKSPAPAAKSAAPPSSSASRPAVSAAPPAAPPAPPRPADGDGVRSAFEAALNQSAPTVTTAPAGLRDMNHSPVLTRRNTMPVPPPSVGAGDLALRPPPRVGIVPMTSAAGVVYFDNSSSKLSENDRNELKKIVNMYKERGGNGSVRVVGHASSRTRNVDPASHQLANFRISLDRANAVARELVRLGVPAGKIAVTAVADNEPVYYEVMPAGEAGNRRAEIFLDY